MPLPLHQPCAIATLAALLCSFGAALAQTPAPPPPACQSAEHRQFDFWLGEWEVFLPNGKKAGDNRIESISAGCALLENWTGNGGFSGKSINSYDSSDKRWHQSWVDSSGSRLELAGSYADRRMAHSGGKIGAILFPAPRHRSPKVKRFLRLFRRRKRKKPPRRAA